MNKMQESTMQETTDFIIKNATPYQRLQIINSLLQDLNKKECFVIDKENPDCRLDNLEYIKEKDTFYCNFANV